MAILKLSPATKPYLWGGTRLAAEYGRPASKGPLAESWELSCHPDGPSRISGGPGTGTALPDYLADKGPRALGDNCRDLPEFPVLIKLIDAKEPLSVQVHPGDGYAFAHEGQQGKTEMWYVIDCDPDAFLYVGFARPVTRNAVLHAEEAGTLPGLLQKVPVRPGDTFVIKAGTVHAIGAGILLAEVQQSSNATYRVYDYGRTGADGRPRPLHVDKALDVTRTAPADPAPPGRRPPVDFGGGCVERLAKTPWFTVDALRLDGEFPCETGGDNFVSVLCTEGSGKLLTEGQELAMQKGGSVFVPASQRRFTLAGTGGFLLTGK